MSQHVLIVGGGLAGPCLALILARRGIRSTIFELRQTTQESGGSISLGPTGLRVLDQYAGVYDKLKPHGFAYTRFGAYTEDGAPLGEIVAGEEKMGGYPALRVMRGTVQKVLIEACEEKKDLIEIRWAARLSKVDEGNSCVALHFEDGTQASGDCLVGADGTRSVVRDSVLGPDAPQPTFVGTATINGFLPSAAAVKPNPDFKLPAFNFTRAGMFMAVPIDAKGEQLTWGITTSLSDRSRAEWAELETSGEGARQAKADFADITTEPIRSLLDSAKEEEARVWPHYAIGELSTWHTSKICLIGDAAHALPPNGLGSGLAFEDAAVLGRLIANKGESSYEDLFKRYEEVRRPRIAAIRKSTGAGGVKGKTGPWIWEVKKVVFRLFFWFKGGLLYHTSETAYDLDKLDIPA